jgi:hypothetical protein
MVVLVRRRSLGNTRGFDAALWLFGCEEDVDVEGMLVRMMLYIWGTLKTVPRIKCLSSILSTLTR